MHLQVGRIIPGADTMAGQDEAATARVRAIADILGIPVRRFYEEPPPGDGADAGELLRLWQRIRTRAGRAAALAALREIAAAEGA